jgi:hypothetical protein
MDNVFFGAFFFITGTLLIPYAIFRLASEPQT